MISQYNATEPACAPANLATLIGKRLTMRGFLVLDHAGRTRDFHAEAAEWLRDGRLLVRETEVDGFENAVDAFLGMLRGTNTGKMIVRL
jgi:NADPH-dependent curcumin reductase CurA